MGAPALQGLLTRAPVQHGPALADALDVLVRLPAHLQLELGAALGPVPLDLAGHGLGLLLGDTPVQAQIPRVAAPQQPVQGMGLDEPGNQ